MSSPHPFLIALQFLTVVPIHFQQPPDKQAVGQSLLYYPLVGLLLGGLLATLAWGLKDGSGLVAAALVLAAWVGSTGALHLDGLADSADAWMGGLFDRQKTLLIMKDPYCGPVAVVTLVTLLLLKFAGIEQLIRAENWQILTLTPVVGRTALVLLFLSTPYVRPGGLGDLLANHLSRRTCGITVILTLGAITFCWGTAAFWLLMVAAGVFFVLRRLMLQRIGGTTGDTAGALVEILETGVLVCAAWMA